MALEPLDGSLFGDDQPCFGCSVNHAIGFRLAFVRDGDDVVARFSPAISSRGRPASCTAGW